VALVFQLAGVVLPEEVVIRLEVAIVARASDLSMYALALPFTVRK
jgi:hypothetical protein